MAVPGSVKAGKISKPYGLQGSVYVILDPVAGKRIEPGDPLFIQMDGQRVPFFVEELTIISDDQVIIKFEFIGNVEEAKSISGHDVYLDPGTDPVVPTGKASMHTVRGYRSYDRSTGYLGPVTDYMEHEMNPVLVVDHHGKELMVPAVDEIIVEINHRKKTILFDLPEGLTAL